MIDSGKAFAMQGSWRMCGRWLALFSSLLLGLIPMGSTPIRAQSPAVRPVSRIAAAGPARFYFGVMGEVVRPGVYELPAASALLVDVMQQAGGLTTRASGNIRVIRNGRAGQQTFYSPRSKFVLLPGDLVVVDARLAGGLGDGQTQRRGSHRRRVSQIDGGGTTVQVAVVGLIDRPVVLKVPGENATVAGVVRRLGQRPEIVPSVRVVQTSAFRRFANSPQTPTTRLVSGSVLVFDPSAVQPHQVGSLPEPYRAVDLEIADRFGLPTETEAVNGQTLPALPAAEGRIESPGRVRITSPEENLPPPPEALEIPDLGDAEAEQPRTPPTSPPRGSAPSIGSTPSPVADSPPIEVFEDSVDDEIAPDDTDAAAGQVSLRPKQEVAADMVTIVVFVIGSLGLAAAFAMLWSMARQTSRSRVKPVSRRKRSLLEALINNDLSLTEEPLNLPPMMEFYGHPLGPRKIRIDSEHQPHKPHFRPRVPDVAEGVESAMQPESPIQPAGKKRSGLLERVLSSEHVYGAAPS